MNGSYAFGDAFDRGGGNLRSSRSRGGGDRGGGGSHLYHPDPHHFGGGGRGSSSGPSLFGGGGPSGSSNDDAHFYGRDPHYGDDYYGRGSHNAHYSDDPRYGGSRLSHQRGGPPPPSKHGLRDSLLLPEEDSYDDSLDGSSSSLKTPPPSSPPPSMSPRPGVQFCSSHDAVSAKIAAFEKSGPAAAPQIEIAPGLTARLRGAKETWQAVENDFYLPTTCFCCQTDLFCIMDANYVLCPSCKVVSPLEGCNPGNDGGVGLGFTYQDLQQWQYEIVVRRQRSGR